MKVRSNIALPYNADRLGVKRGIIEIDLIIEKKDDIKKVYTLRAVDYLIDETKLDPIYGVRKIINNKTYVKTYDEYDAQRAVLLAQDTSGLTGSALDDKLLQDGLLYSLLTDPIYESQGTDWVAYIDPVVVPSVNNTPNT